MKSESATLDLKLDVLSLAARDARGLAIDAVHAAGIGHLGLPLGCAEIGAVLYGKALRVNPDEPRWLNRDRFVLSAGHGSMFLYAWLHMSGFDLPLEQIKNFRQLHSHTPGHPEFSETPGVEATTGPLGQGTANAVGMAIAGKMLAARLNTPEHTIIDYQVVALVGDGCLQEGISHEACSLAGHLGLDNLIYIYDDNDITLDAMADATQSEDTGKRFEAYGWDVQRVDGHNMPEFLAAFEKARHTSSGKPQIIIAKTEAGRGIPEVAGTSKAHGEGGHKHADSARKGLGLPEELFHVSPEVKEYFAAHKQGLVSDYDAWKGTFDAWAAANPDRKKLVDDAESSKRPSAADLLAMVPAFEEDAKLATRAAGGKVLNAMAQNVPTIISGSADLHGSTKNYLDGMDDFTRTNPNGRNLLFGIREHAMGGILNGFGYDGHFIASGATFATFADYCRPAIRLAALSRLNVFYIFTHDSVGVGEDGPTHQPVEINTALRAIPFLNVIRPADPEETAGAFAAAISRTDGPTALILTRQSVPMMNSIPPETRREGVLQGGYIAKKEAATLETILLASGSELQHAMAAANELGDGVRVVSMPCFELFDAQPQSYRDEVLPPSCRKRVSIEAGVSLSWDHYVGLDGKVVAINRFGLSAPGGEVMKELGMTKDSVIAAVKSLG